jgi:hypothetical protein
MLNMTPEEEASYAIGFNVSRSDLSSDAARAEYDRLRSLPPPQTTTLPSSSETKRTHSWGQCWCGQRHAATEAARLNRGESAKPPFPPQMILIPVISAVVWIIGLILDHVSIASVPGLGSLSAPQVNNLCNTGLGQFAQLDQTIATKCSEAGALATFFGFLVWAGFVVALLSGIGALLAYLTNRRPSAKPQA